MRAEINLSQEAQAELAWVLEICPMVAQAVVAQAATNPDCRFQALLAVLALDGYTDRAINILRRHTRLVG